MFSGFIFKIEVKVVLMLLSFFEIIVHSHRLDELMEISDTFAVLAEGRLSEPQLAAGITIEEIGLMMGGEAAA